MRAASLSRDHSARWLHGHKPSKSARSDTLSVKEGISSSCIRRANRQRRARRDSRLGRSPDQGSAKGLGVVLQQLTRRSARRRGTALDHQVDPTRREKRAIPAKNLPNPPSQPVAGDGVARAPRDRNAQPRARLFASPLDEKLEKASRHPDARGVALFEVPSLSKAVVAREGLPGDPARVHTVSLLRPFRRRAEITARPERVRIRTKNPWVRLRRRLLG